MSTTGGNDGETLFHETTERLWILRLVTEIRESGVHVRLEPLQRSFRRIPPTRIQGASVTSYEATTHAGWHWGVRRTPGGNAVYRLRGSRGVEIVQETGERWFIGSRRPDELESAIKRISTTNE